MAGISTSVFNQHSRIVEGWYWALRSSELKNNKLKGISFLGMDVVVARSASGVIRVFDAYCPHMGAHLAEGRVEGESVRCLFHYWKFNESGACTEIPCQKDLSRIPSLRKWNAEEKYGMVWIWYGAGEPTSPVPFAPELEGADVAAKLGNRFEKNCHPHVVMINAIDANHFNSVHNLPVHLDLQGKVRSPECIEFSNVTRVPRTSFLTRFISHFYKGALTYSMSYWFGSTGSVTLGPDFLHFYIIFALRPTQAGRTEGQTILVTRFRKGFWGRLVNPLLLKLTQIVGDYFAKGDTLIFQTIKFNFRTPLKADQAIIQFVQHVEKQRTGVWGKVPETPEVIKETQWKMQSEHHAHA